MKELKYCCVCFLVGLVGGMVDAAPQMVSVSAQIEGESVSYLCGAYDPPVEVELFSHGSNVCSSATNVVRSLYTQMADQDWDDFVDLWDDFLAPYTEPAVAAPPPEFFKGGWSYVMSNSKHLLKYRIVQGDYTLLVVDTERLDGSFVVRNAPVLKQVGERYYLTHDLSLQENLLDLVIDDFRFHPQEGKTRTVEVAGTVQYSGQKSGDIHVAVARNTTSNAWGMASAVVIASPGQYAVSNVVYAHEYVVKAFLDEDGDGEYSQSEPMGWYSENPISSTNDHAGVTVVIHDP